MLVKALRYILCRILCLILFFKDFKVIALCFTILTTVILVQNSLEEEVFSSLIYNLDLILSHVPFLPFLILVFLVSQRGVFTVHNLVSIAIALCLIAFFVASSLHSTYSKILPKIQSVQSFTDKTVSLEGKILSVENSGQYILESKANQVGDILLKVGEYTDLQPGFHCKISGILVEPESFEDFDYKRYLYRKGIYSILEVNEYECSEKGFNLLLLRSKLEKVISKGLSEPEASLLIGVLFGSKRIFTKDFNLALQNSGLSHIISASGYNVALVASVVDRVFKGYTGKISILLKILAIWSFSTFAGLSSSLIRASTMSSIHLFALLLGRDIPKGVLIIFCITVLVLINPFIIHDIGFLLSSSATVGLIFFPKCFNVKNSWVKDSLLPTITCTIFTLPVVIYFFNKVSLISVLSNLVAGPIVQSTVGWGIFVVLLNTISKIFQPLFFVPFVQLNLFKYVVEISSVIQPIQFDFDSKILVLVILVCIFTFCLLKYPISNENYYLKKAKSLLN